MIHVTFANGNAIKTGETPETAIVVRGIMDVFKLAQCFGVEDLQRQFPLSRELYLADLIELAKNESRTKVSMIYLHLDEFNVVPATLLSEMISRLSTAMMLENTFFYPFFTGTTYCTMKELGIALSNPFVEIQMKVLSETGARITR
jgi:hypothetical protein